MIDLAQARISLEKILNALGVTRVINVDDANDKSITVEDIISTIPALDLQAVAKTFPELSDFPLEDYDILTAKIRSIWDRLTPEARAERGQAVLFDARQHGHNSENDIADAFILSQLIPEEKLISITPSQWHSKKDLYLQESKKQVTLFLFDQDFSKAGGHDQEGISIIASLLSKDDSRSCFMCGLLTHTVSPGTLLQQWDELSKKHGISRERFVVIPKLHLSEKPALFAQALKFVALAPDFSELKSKTTEIFEKAVTAAAERVEKINIYDLEHIVLHLSAQEGLWEPDMLFRLHAMFHHMESRRLAYDGGVLETIAARLRDVSGIPTSCDDLPTHASAWELQREELYESDKYINGNHLPIELGDIFERVDSPSSKKYLVLAPPCDLMVRAKGRREPDIQRIPLAEIVQKTNSSVSRTIEEMPYFGETPQEQWYVNLKAIHYVRACILDLSVFDKDGVSKLILHGDAPSAIRPTWKARHAILQKTLSGLVSKADLFASIPNESEAVRIAKNKFAPNLSRLLFGDDLFKGNLTEDNGKRIITFNCKRRGRLSRVRAIGLLLSYTGILGRPAYERDLG